MRFLQGTEASSESRTSAAILKFPFIDVIDALSRPQSTDERIRLVAKAARDVPLSRLLSLAQTTQDVLLLSALCDILGMVGGDGEGGSHVASTLLSLAQHAHSSVRFAAAEALGRLNATPEIRERLRVMAESDESVGVRAEAREALDDLNG